MAYWIKISYERNNYVIDLDRIGAFCHVPSSRLTFNLPDSNSTIIINQQSSPEVYQKILDYIEKKTGQQLP